jgi:site-specific DNA-methyltransferase (cytosine-N4-specific)
MEIMKPLYLTNFGAAFVGDSLNLLDELKPESINLVVTSPPFCLQRQKKYGNLPEKEYVGWLAEFAKKVKNVLANDGSFVLDLGGAYESGRPIRSLYNYKILINFCDELGFNLAEEFFWFNPAKLPSPIEWVNKRKIRAKDAVNTIWWFSKADYPKADITKVIVPYSPRMQRLIKERKKFYTPKLRPSGHNISRGFEGVDRGGALPSNYLIDATNALEIANTEATSKYLRNCSIAGAEPNPARFPKKIPDFFIRFLTDKGDTVLDIFAGSNTTGEAAEDNERKWIAFESERKYLASSSLRFLETKNEEKIKNTYQKLMEEQTFNYKIFEKEQILKKEFELPIVPQISDNTVNIKNS